MENVAIYARYSTDQQRESSLADQITRCKQVAVRAGFVVNPELVFTDAALSGAAKHTEKREGYQALLKKMDAGQVDVLIVDEFSRVSRDAVDQAHFIRRLEQNQRLRMLTADGMDTSIQNWQMSIGMVGLMSQQFLRDTTNRVKRGMLGQLERGYMIATPAFGYELKRELDAQGNRSGTHWQIAPADAKVVRQIFEQRGQGQSMHQIARALNDAGISTCRPGRKRMAEFWRASRVKGILRNPIYRGEFHYNGSTTYQARAKKMGVTVSIQRFARPQLRLVSDELWHRCNQNIISRSGYGGGEHAFSGLIQCGHCAGTLVLTSSKHRSRAAYCATCTTSKAMKVDKDAQTSTISVEGLKHLLTTALGEFVTPAFVKAFHDQLKAKLTGNFEKEIASEKATVARLERVQERLSYLLASEDDQMLHDRYREAKNNHADAKARLHALEARQLSVDAKAIKAQLAVDPRELVVELFEKDILPEKLRSMLVRLFPKIIFDGKTSTFRSNFTIQFSLDAALALASNTEKIGQMVIQKRYALRYSRSPRTPKVGKWIATEIAASKGSDGRTLSALSA